MCRPRLKKRAYGADQTEKVGAFRDERMVKVVPLEKWVHSEKVGAFRANRTEKVGAFRANKTKKWGLYRGTYPGVLPPGVELTAG